MKAWTRTRWEKLCGTTSTACTGYGQSRSPPDERSRVPRVPNAPSPPRCAVTTTTTTAASTCCWSAPWRCLSKPWPATPSRPPLASTSPSGGTSDTRKRCFLPLARGHIGLVCFWPGSLKALTFSCSIFAGSRQSDSDGSSATSSPSLYLTSHYSLHEMTPFPALSCVFADAEPAVPQLTYTHYSECILSYVSVLTVGCYLVDAIFSI